MTRLALLSAALVGLAPTATSASDGYIPANLTPHGGVEGGDALILPRGDILNVRNIQGGTIHDPNLDLGAGSSTHRGTLALNYDVGRTVKIYDGHKHLLASFSRGGIRFYQRISFGRAR